MTHCLVSSAAGSFRAPQQTPPCQAPHPFRGDRQESFLSLSTHIQMNTKPCLFSLQNVFQMSFPTFPLLLFFLLPKMLFFSCPSSLFKILLSPKGILTCYHLREVFPSFSWWCSFLPLPTFPCRCPPSHPWILPAFACCGFELCENGSLEGSLVEEMCPLHQNPLNKFLLEIGARKNIGSRSSICLLFYETVRTSYDFAPFYLSYQEV